MAGTSQARDGRMALSFILEKKDEPITGASGSLAIGEMGFIISKASSTSAFGDIPVGCFFIASASTTLKEGDSIQKVKPYFLGFATSKSLSQSKNVVDVTMDYDAATNNVSDGVVSSSGSISGSAITETLNMESGINILQSRFTSIVSINGSTIEYKEAQTTEKDILMLGWNFRDCKVGEFLDIDIVPALFSNLSKDASYGSSQTFNVDYTGNFSDENNFVGGHYIVKNVEGLLPSIARPQAAS